MSNYETMSNDELRRVIAERIGWHVVQHGGLWMVTKPRYTEADVHTFAEKDHERWGRYGRKTLDDAWRHELSHMPDWLESIDSALTLIKTDGSQVIDMHWNPGRHPEHNNFVVLYDRTADQNYSASGFEGSVPLARVICLAWLAWKDKN